jgi:O-antigen ligase
MNARASDGWTDLFGTWQGWAWLLSLMLLAWAPLPGEQRLPATLMVPFGLWLLLARRDTVANLPGLRVMNLTFLLIFLPALISLPGSSDLRSTLGVLVIGALSYCVGLVLLAGLASRPARQFSLGVTVILLFWALDGIVQWLFGVDLFGVPLNVQGRVFGLFADNQRMGYLLGVLIPVATLPLAARRPYLAMALYAALTFAVGLVGARSALVFALLSAPPLLYTLPTWRPRLALGVAGVLVVAAALIQSPVLSERVLHRDYARHLNDPALAPDEALFLQVDDVLSGRLKIWATAWNMVRANPVAGVGAGAFDNAYDRYSTRPDDQFTSRGGYPGGVHHAHQLYVSAAAETGLVGLGAIIAMLVMLWRWYRALPEAGRRAAFPYACSLGVAFFPLNSQHSLYIGWWYATILLILCAMLTAGEGAREDAP